MELENNNSSSRERAERLGRRRGHLPPRSSIATKVVPHSTGVAVHEAVSVGASDTQYKVGHDVCLLVYHQSDVANATHF